MDHDIHHMIIMQRQNTLDIMNLKDKIKKFRDLHLTKKLSLDIALKNHENENH